MRRTPARMQALQPSDIPLLIAALERTVENRRRWPLYTACYMVYFVAASAALYSLEAALHWHASVMSAAGPVVLSLYGLPRRMRAARNQAAITLVDLDDVRAIGPLVVALGQVSDALRPSVQDAIIRLLPRLEDGDDLLLGAEARERLRDVLTAGPEPLILAVLEALPRIGDASFIPVVEAVAAGKGPGVLNRGLREEARRCLPGLRAHAASAEQRATLLRAADAAAAAPTLMRPAAAGEQDASGAVLLRTAGDAPTQS